MIEAKKIFEAFQKHRDNAIVAVQGTSGHHWNVITTNPNRDIFLGGAMGQSTSAVFGLALGLKDEKVVHFDTEGALLMNLGVLASIAGKRPKNFVHFLLDNECYATTGGQPVPNGEDINYAQMAAAAGYKSTYNFTDLEELTTSMEEIMNTEGPVFVAIKINAEIQNLPMGLREKRNTRSRAQTINDLREELNIK
jgi:thiamine pyrophosphate-dependent acetolactate synthase large subunit-like protein